MTGELQLSKIVDEEVKLCEHRLETVLYHSIMEIKYKIFKIKYKILM